MIELYGTGGPNVLKVLLMLSETNLGHEFREVDVFAGEQFEPGFLALSPNGKVPVIVDHDGPSPPHVVFESGAILIYLAEKTGRFLPAELAARSRALQWLMFQMASIGPIFGQAIHFKFVAPKGNDYSRHRYDSEVTRLYDVCEKRLSETAWLGGSEYSIADIAAFPWIGKYVKTFEIDLSARPALANWIARIEDREAYRRVSALGDALFKKAQERRAMADPAALRRFFRQA